MVQPAEMQDQLTLMIEAAEQQQVNLNKDPAKRSFTQDDHTEADLKHILEAHEIHWVISVVICILSVDHLCIYMHMIKKFYSYTICPYY
jgi:hypothetical protein